jgi:Ca2+-binding EF-hand superfamily protein
MPALRRTLLDRPRPRAAWLGAALCLSSLAAAQSTLPQMPRTNVSGARRLNSQGVTTPFLTPPTPNQIGLLPAPVFPRSGLERTIKVPLPVGAAGARARQRSAPKSPAVDYDPERSREIFAAADHDEDGYLTLREAHGALKIDPEAFERADRNGDRLLSFTEFDERLRSSITWGGFFIDTVKAERKKAAKEEKLSFESVARDRVRARIAMADADANGRLAEAELAQLLPTVAPRWQSLPFLNRYDVDGDGGIDEEELYQAVLDLRASGDPDIGRKAESISRELAALRDDAAARAGALLRAFDRYRDVAIDTLEMEAALASLDTPLSSSQLLLLDRNQDLELDRAELEAALSEPTSAQILGPLADFLAERFPMGLVPTPLSKLDGDHDDRASLEELGFWLSKHPDSVPASALMAKFDRDRDGYLDLLEMLRLLGREPATSAPTPGSPSPREALPESLRLLDRDDDGALTYGEIAAVFEARLGVPGQGEKIFAQCDRNADGKLDASELATVFGNEVATAGDANASAPPAEPSPREQLLRAHDADGDGGFGLEEIERWADERGALVSAPALLRSADRDRDGKLKAEELDAALALERTEDPSRAAAESSSAEAQTRLPLPQGLLALDGDADRRISPRELAAALGAEQHARIRALFRAHDIDASGFLESAELRWLGLR